MRADTCVFYCDELWAGQAVGSDGPELCPSRSVRAQAESLPPQGSLRPAPRPPPDPIRPTRSIQNNLFLVKVNRLERK